MTRSGQISAGDIRGIYAEFIAIALDNDNMQLAKSVYAEAQIAFGYTTNDPDYASEKQYFEDRCKEMGLF